MRLGKSLVHTGTLSAGMISSFHLNSVGCPHETPTICPTHAPFILSRYSSSVSVRSAAEAAAAAIVANAIIFIVISLPNMMNLS